MVVSLLVVTVLKFNASASIYYDGLGGNPSFYSGGSWHPYNEFHRSNKYAYSSSDKKLLLLRDCILCNGMINTVH